MKHHTRPQYLLFLAALLMVAWTGFGCTTYDPPPTVALDLPPGGVYPTGSALLLEFSEPIKPGSLAIRIWPASPDDITIENEFIAGLKPTVDTCAIGAGTCTYATVNLAEDARSATIQIDGEPFDATKVPWRLEISAGLEDLEGNATGIEHYFDFQFSPCPESSTDNVDFDEGYYLLISEVADPLPIVLTLYNHIRVLPDGRFRWIGVDGNVTDGFAKNTSDPAGIYLNQTENGFALFAQGNISANEDTRCLASEPFQVLIRIDALKITLSNMRLNGAVLKNTETGSDRLEGTISFETLTLDTGGGEPFVYDAGSASFFAERLTDDQLPDGLPQLCTSLCGDISAQCEPPADFATTEFCPVETSP